MDTPVITREIAAKVLSIVDAGLVRGLGAPVAGKMCVLAAICFALGLSHGDDPKCVSPAGRALKISLNDRNWSSNAARAKGLRRLALALLGSLDVIDDKEFAKRLAELAIRQSVPLALRAAAPAQKNAEHKAALLDAAMRCEKEGTEASARDAKRAANAANAAYANAADAAANAAKDKALSDFAEGVVQILIAMNAPGCQWLDLAEAT